MELIKEKTFFFRRNDIVESALYVNKMGHNIWRLRNVVWQTRYQKINVDNQAPFRYLDRY